MKRPEIVVASFAELALNQMAIALGPSYRSRDAWAVAGAYISARVSGFDERGALAAVEGMLARADAKGVNGDRVPAHACAAGPHDPSCCATCGEKIAGENVSVCSDHAPLEWPLFKVSGAAGRCVACGRAAGYRVSAQAVAELLALEGGA